MHVRMFRECCCTTKVSNWSAAPCACLIRSGGWSGRWAGDRTPKTPDGGQSAGHGRWVGHAIWLGHDAPAWVQLCSASGWPRGHGSRAPMICRALPWQRTPPAAPRRREQVRPGCRPNWRWAAAAVPFPSNFHWYLTMKSGKKWRIIRNS